MIVPRRLRPRQRKIIFAAAIAIVIAAIVLLDAFMYEPSHPKVYRVEIGFDRIPPQLSRLRIVHLSDLHIVKPGIREQRLVRMVNALHPDLLFLTGDYIKDDGITPGPQDWQSCTRNAVSILRKLRPRLGSYAVLGNWDFSGMAPELEKAGIKVLQDQAVRVNIGGVQLRIAGADGSRGGLLHMTGDLRGEDFAILLSHMPEVIHTAASLPQPYELVLAGHYHGGQVRIPFVRRIIGHEIPYQAGLYKIGRTWLYVNRGIGMHTVGARFLCRPEITLIKLTSMPL